MMRLCPFENPTFVLEKWVVEKRSAWAVMTSNVLSVEALSQRQITRFRNVCSLKLCKQAAICDEELKVTMLTNTRGVNLGS